MKQKILIFVKMFLVINFISCNQLTEPDDNTGTIKGVVKTVEGDTLLAEVTIYTNPQTSVVTTNSSGEYSLNNVTEGDYYVIATKSNYKKDSIAIKVIKNKTTNADLRLKYESQQISYGLIAYYPFSGNANDESGNNFNGVVNGAVSTSDRFNNTNKAYYFSGNSSWIQANNLPQINNNFSYCVWIKIDSTGLSNRNYNFGCYGKENNGVASWDFAYHPIKQAFEIFNRPSDEVSKTYLLDYNWHFVVITFGNNSKNLFVDGLFVESKNVSLPIPILSSNNLRIGAHINDGSQQFRGCIDDVRIYDKILSTTEILQLYREGGYNQGNSSEAILFTYKINNQSDIWKIQPDGSGISNLISWPASNERKPILSPDGSKLAFISNKSGKYQIWISNPDGSNPKQITLNSDIETKEGLFKGQKTE